MEKREFRFKRTFYFLLFMTFLLAILSGCTINEVNNNDVTDRTKQEEKYINEQYEFVYPSQLITLKEEGGIVTLSHSIPYEHQDPCDLRGSDNGDVMLLKDLTDFDVKMEIIEASLEDTVANKLGDNFKNSYVVDHRLQIQPNFIDEISINDRKGYKITMGAEGCGMYIYIFPLEAEQHFVVTRKFISELNPINANYEEYSQVPRIILPREEEKLFDQIISSLKFTNK